jgi:hypothetical protein
MGWDSKLIGAGIGAVRDAGWAPGAVFGLHLVIARGLNAYTVFPDLDMPMHFLGGMAVAFFFRVALLRGAANGSIGARQARTLGFLVLALSCCAASAWEVAEFLSDRYLGTHAQLGPLDTLSDMLFGIGGAATFLFWRGSRGGYAVPRANRAR